MEIKDAVISTLAEIELKEKQDIEEEKVVKKSIKNNIKPKKEKKIKPINKRVEHSKTIINNDEAQYLKSLRERVLVLFEGLQSPNNQQLEAKLNLTLNFLEYQLATIDERLNKIKSN